MLNAKVEVHLALFIVRQLLKLANLQLLHCQWLLEDTVQIGRRSGIRLPLYARLVELFCLDRVDGHLLGELCNVGDLGLCGVQPTRGLVVLWIGPNRGLEIDRALAVIAHNRFSPLFFLWAD